MGLAKKAIVVFLHAVVGWGLCGAIIGIGRSVTTVEITLVVHAIAVPLIFSGISFVYFRSFHYSSPLTTAVCFTALVILLDATVVAPLAERSFVMFTSLLGTWIPFGLIFLSTFVTGSLVRTFSRKGS